MNKQVMILLVILLAFVGCKKTEEELITVTIVKVHKFGDDGNGWLNERFTHAYYQNIDTGERFSSRSIMGVVGDTFKVYESNLR